jgi:hypothetical protein
VLVVKIEIWPGGRESAACEIGRMFVANVTDEETPQTDAYYDGKRGDYFCAVAKKGSTIPPIEMYYPRIIDERFRKGPKPTRSGLVRNYPRKSYVVWRLILRALRACFPEEK